MKAQFMDLSRQETTASQHNKHNYVQLLITAKREMPTETIIIQLVTLVTTMCIYYTNCNKYVLAQFFITKGMHKSMCK